MQKQRKNDKQNYLSSSSITSILLSIPHFSLWFAYVKAFNTISNTREILVKGHRIGEGAQNCWATNKSNYKDNKIEAFTRLCKMSLLSLRHQQSSGFVAVVFVLVICSSSTCGKLVGDIDLLKALKNTLVDYQLVIPSWFNPEIAPCNWTGIACQGLRVISLNLSCIPSLLSLQFPDMITEFKYLKFLNLSQCGFTGVVPPGIWSLGDLESLDLSGNNLHGILPQGIANLRSLRRLVLDGMNLSGTLPSRIGELQELEELSVSSNAFSGILPQEIGNLQKLQSLDLRKNHFSGNLPSSLGNLTSLLYLMATENNFSGSIFPEIENMKMLKTLDLSKNSMTGPIPATIGNLKNLMILSLEGNELTGNIPEEISELGRLTNLNLAQNGFEGELPSNIGKLLNLESLVAWSAGLSGKIPPQLGNCKKLRSLSLSFNSLSGPIPDELSNMRSIVLLALDSNRLSGTFPKWISKWRRVRTILLQKNALEGSLPPLDLPSLISLDVSFNNLSGELPEGICNAQSLTVLNLSGNNFSGGIETTFKNCTLLTDLVLSANHLSGEIPSYLGQLRLNTLELSANKFSGKVPDQLWDSKTLMEISLSNNMLEGPISDSVSKVSTLQRLQLDNNLFGGSIPSAIGKLKNLTNLSLNGNRLNGVIPLELCECTELVCLDLSSNRLTGPIPESISHLKLLDSLKLSNNRFSGSIPESICSGFQKVREADSEFVQHCGMIDLSNNELEGPIPTSIGNCKIVSRLLLSRNRLNGSIPGEIYSLVNLSSLDLSFNHLSGPLLPLLSPLNHLQGLILSDNQISGPIPDDFWSMVPNLAKLDLSGNQLNGTIAPSLFRMKSLAYLDVSKNSFSGNLSFDNKIDSSLVFLNASNNQLSGRINEFVSNPTSLSVVDIHNNSFTGSLPESLSSVITLTYLDLSNNNFQGIFRCDICNIQGLEFVNFSGNKFTGDVPNTCSMAEKCLTNQSSYYPSSTYCLSRTTVIAIAMASSLISLVLTVGLVGWRMLRQDILLLDRDDGKSKKMATDELASCDELLGNKLKDLSINVATFEHMLSRINPAEILVATENFSNSCIIGDGGYGTVYKASFPGRTIAVKRLRGGLVEGTREFFAEMETVGKIKHEHLVPLLGYCVFAEERFLIYEYMENGSLDVWLRNRPDGLIGPLDWPTRFKICLGSAKGLAFLHHGIFPHIIHRDIKSSNILLDRNFEARVSDFGLARIISACESHVTTLLAGTFGYIPPEYCLSMVSTTRGDVYSFGVVMLELITGQAPIGQADKEGGNLVGWVRWMSANGKEHEVLDPTFSDLVRWKDQISQVLNIAKHCTLNDPWKRPSMLDVVKMLKKLR